MTSDLILVPVDYTGCATTVCDTAADLARRLGARVLLLNVTQPPPGVPSSTPVGDGPASLSVEALLDGDAQAHLTRLAEVFAAEGVPTETRIVHGAPAKRILEVADAAAATMIVVGTRGRKGVRRLVLGSVCEEVVRNADVPVLTVRSGDWTAHPGRTAAQLAAEAETAG